MSQIYGENGNVIPVTVIEVEPNTIVQIKGKDKDGYEAVQVGYGTRKEKNIKSPQKGHFKKLGNFAVLKEFRFDSKGKKSRGEKQELIDSANLTVGQKLDVTVFAPGDKVRVAGTTKGRGFQGVVKRHGFHGGPKTHGQSDRERHPGSIGSTTTPGRVYKGKRMAGRMGNDTVTIKNLLVMDIDTENNILFLKGLVPGAKNGLLTITKLGTHKKFVPLLKTESVENAKS